jgi:hypothetical protein
VVVPSPLNNRHNFVSFGSPNFSQCYVIPVTENYVNEL